MRTDVLKKYNIFNIVLFLWIAFLPLKNAVYQGAVVLMVLFFIFHIIYLKKISVLKELLLVYKDIILAFLLLMFSMLLSSAINENSESLSNTLKFMYRYFFIFVILLYFYKEGFFTKRNLLICIVFSLSIYSLDGLYQYITGFDFLKNHPWHGNGLSGVFFNRNIFGFIMSISSCLTFALLLSPNIKNKTKLMIFLLFLISSFTLFNSLSRASWLMFLSFSFMYMFLLFLNNNLKLKNILIICLSILFCVAVFFLSEDLQNRLNSLLQGDSSERFTIWSNALVYIKESVFFGYGIGSFVNITKMNYAGIHNMTIEILFYLGSFGLLAYLYMFFNILKEVYKTKKYTYAAFLLSFLLLLQFDGSLVNSKLDVSILIIILFFIYSSRVSNEHIKNKG